MHAHTVFTQNKDENNVIAVQMKNHTKIFLKMLWFTLNQEEMFWIQVHLIKRNKLH
jgi:hypothetical protein